MLGTLTELLGHFYQYGHFTQLEAVARTVLTTIPDDMVALHFLGLAYLRTGRSSEATKLFRRIDQSALNKEHRVAIESGHDDNAPTAASAIYREATDLNPRFADTWYDIAMELQRLGHSRRALSALQNAIVARPDFHEALLALGELGLRTGDCAAAYRGYAGLLRLDPGCQEAKQGLECLAKRQSEAEPAGPLFTSPAAQTAVLS